MKTRFFCFFILALMLLISCGPKPPLSTELLEVTGVQYFQGGAELLIIFKEGLSATLNYYVDEQRTEYLDFSKLVNVPGRTLSQENTTGNQLWFWPVIPPLDPIGDAGIIATFDTSTWFYRAWYTDVIAKCRIITDSMSVTFMP